MPIEALFIIENAPPGPVFTTVAGAAGGTVENCHFHLELMQRSNITSKNETANALKILRVNWGSKEAHKTMSTDLAAIAALKEGYPPGFLIASGASKAVLGYGMSAFRAFGAPLAVSLGLTVRCTAIKRLRLILLNRRSL